MQYISYIPSAQYATVMYICIYVTFTHSYAAWCYATKILTPRPHYHDAALMTETHITVTKQKCLQQ